MKLYLDALWRALAYCLLPRVIWLSVLPLVLCVGVTGLLSYFFWEAGVAQTHALLDGWSVTQWLLHFLDMLGWSSLRSMVAPLVLVLVAVPVIVILCLLMVAQIMVPSLVTLVRARRFPDLQVLGSGNWFLAALRSTGWTILAALLLLVSLPLWFIPPLGLIIPPVIWGWLSYRVMTSDVLSGVATRAERAAIFREHRWPLWVIGLITGYLGAAPTLLWAMGIASLIFAPFVFMVSAWLYTGIFVFSALWFTHYALKALHTMRTGSEAEVVSAPDAMLGQLQASGAPGLPPPSDPGAA